jgi:hypothetical protein
VAKFLCECGATIRMSGEIPNPQQWLLISDASFDRFAGEVDADDVYSAMLLAYLCDDCGRLGVLERGHCRAGDRVRA